TTVWSDPDSRVRGVVRTGELLLESARLGSGDEGFRNCAGSTRRGCGSRALVDGDEDDVAGSFEGRRFGSVANPGSHDVHPDRERRFRTGLVVPDRLLLIEADPHAKRDVGIEPDEPRIRVVVGRPGLPAERPVER